MTLQEEDLSRALHALEAGQSVGFPTETVWGIGADARSEDAIARLNALKDRGSDKALQVSCATPAFARALAAPQQPLLDRLLAWLPGPLTLVAWAAPDCPPWLQKEGKVGLRVPDHPTIQELLRRFGGPLATTSLNPSGLPPARNYAEAAAYQLAAALLDGPAPSQRQASTVLDCTTGQILREGDLATPLRAILP